MTHSSSPASPAPVNPGSSGSSGSFAKWVIAAVIAAIVCAGLAYVITKVIVKSSYTATTTMEILASSTNQGKSPPEPTQDVTLAQTYAAVAQERSVTHPAYIRASQTMDPLATSILPNESPSTTCQATALTALVTCSVSAHSATFAKAAANAVALTFIQEQRAWPTHRFWSVLVTNPAELPTSPSSPHATINALVVFVIVLLVVGGFGYAESRYPGWRSRIL